MAGPYASVGNSPNHWFSGKILFFKILVFCSLLLALIRIVVFESFFTLPLVFFILGIGLSIFKKIAPVVFLILVPIINSSPALFSLGYPHNYLAPLVFVLGGIFIGLVLSKDRFIEDIWDEGSDWYLFFLIILILSSLFLFLKWSNLTLPGKAFGANTPVSPKMERISFGSIFPVVTVFLYGMSPVVFFYFRKIKFPPLRAFKILSYGFYFSVGIAIFQKLFHSSFMLHRITSIKNQYNGGFSDYNSLGFFSGFMFLWGSEHIKQRTPVSFITLIMSLVGIFISGSRTAFFFILIGLINLFFGFSSRNQKRIFVFVVVLVLLMVLILGGTFKTRLVDSFKHEKNLFDTINRISNGRLWMGLFCLKTIQDFYLSGIGTGNFTFFLDYQYFNKPYVYDLALNQYLQVFIENGFWGFLFFVLFLIYIFLKSTKKLLVGSILFMLLFNNYFWFPETLILFWLVAALFYEEKKINIRDKIPYFRIMLWCSLFSFVFSSIFTFSSLHPKNWAIEKGTGYDYGFWAPEENRSEEIFSWTHEESGIYITLNQRGESQPFRIFCGAPLRHFPERIQKVHVFWRGEKIREIVFKQNRAETFWLRGKPNESGFMELRIIPAFSLKQMNLGEEERILGVQFIYP